MVHPELHNLVDGLRLPDPLVETENSLVDHRHQDPVGDETGGVVDLDRRLAHPPRRRLDRLPGFLAGGEAANDLDELHHRHGVHEVHADHLLRPRGGGGQLGDRDRAGVGGEQGVGRAQPVEVAQDLPLDVEPLDDGLDHQVGSRQVRQLARRSSTGPATRRAASAESFPLPTSRSSPLPICVRPRSSASATASTRITSYPLCAATWAMPCPIVPAPTTPIVSMGSISCTSLRTRYRKNQAERRAYEIGRQGVNHAGPGGAPELRARRPASAERRPGIPADPAPPWRPAGSSLAGSIRRGR